MSETPTKYRIAMLAPPWLPVPPSGYGGIESVVALLCEGLVRRGHDVTLFAGPGSRSSAQVRTILPACHPDRIERALYEVDHVARVFAEIDQAGATNQPFDVIHDHCGFTAFAMADRIATPLVHTLHGPFIEETTDFYRAHAGKAHTIAISASQRAAAPPSLRITGVIPNPIDVAEWPLRRRKENFLLWIGRMVADKGPHRAITAARRANTPLVLAGPVQPGQEEYFQAEIAPHLDSGDINYVGEVGGEAKRALFAAAKGLLMPIRWAEPFGMVMIEAMACGTPVVAFPEGAAAEIVQPGVTGFLVADEAEMAAAISRLADIDPLSCRRVATERYGVDQIAASYEAAYRRILAAEADDRARYFPAPVRSRMSPVAAIAPPARAS